MTCLLALLDFLVYIVEDLKANIGRSVNAVSMMLKNVLSMSNIWAYPEW